MSARRTTALLLGAALALSACSSCKDSTPTVDAGTRLKLKPPERAERSTDLRTVLLLVYPEFRGVEVVTGSATLTRQLSGADDWERAARDAMKLHHFEELDDAGVTGRRGPMSIALVAPGRVAVSVALNSDVVAGVYESPAAMGTLAMGQYMPRDAKLVSVREDFDFELTWEAVTAGRAAFVSWQVVDLLLQNGQWKGPLPEGFHRGRYPDGGAGEVPSRFQVTVTGVVDGARITVERDEKLTTVRYHLVTLEPPPG